jgi:hypothetical protein
VLTLDATTAAEFEAGATADARAQIVLQALASPVAIKVYDNTGAVVGQGAVTSPWATRSGATLIVGEVQWFQVDVSGTPDPANWLFSLESGTRWLRGSFGLSASAADIRWSSAAWTAGQVGNFGSIVFTARGASSTPPPTVDNYFEFADIPEIVFVRGIAEHDDLCQFIVDPNNRLQPGQTAWLTGAIYQKHADHGGGNWSPSRAVTVLGTLPAGVTWDAGLARLVYDGSGTPTASETVTIRLKAGAIESENFNVRVLVPTIVYGDGAVALNAQIGWGVPGANVVDRNYTLPGYEGRWEQAYRKMRTYGASVSYSVPNVFFVTSGTYDAADGEAFWNISPTTPDGCADYFYILGDPRNRPVLDAYEGPDDGQEKVWRSVLQYSRLRYWKNFDLEAIAISAGAAAGIEHIPTYGLRPYVNYVTKIDQHHSYTNNDFIGMSLAEADDGNGPAYPGTWLHVWNMRQSELGGSGNTYHSMYLEGRPHSKGRINNILIDGTRLCSAIQSTMFNISIVNCQLNIVPGNDPDWTGFRTTDQFDIHSCTQATVYNNLVVTGRGDRYDGQGNEGCLSGPIFLEGRRALYGGNDTPPYPNITWQRLPEDVAFQAIEMKMDGQTVYDSIPDLDDATRNAYNALIEAQSRADYIADVFNSPGVVARIYRNITSRDNLPEMDAATADGYEFYLTAETRAAYFAETFNAVGVVARIYHVDASGITTVLAEAAVTDPLTAEGAVNTLSIPPLVPTQTWLMSAKGKGCLFGLFVAGRSLYDSVGTKSAYTFKTVTNQLTAGVPIQVTGTITHVAAGIVYAEAPCIVPPIANTGATTTFAIPPLVPTVDYDMTTAECQFGLFIGSALLSDNLNTSGARFICPSMQLTTGVPIQITGTAVWLSRGRAYHSATNDVNSVWTEFTNRPWYYGAGSTHKDWKIIVEPGEMPEGLRWTKLVRGDGVESSLRKYYRTHRDASNWCMTSMFEYGRGIIDGWDYDDPATFADELFWQEIATRPLDDMRHPHTWKHFYSFNKFVRLVFNDAVNLDMPLTRVKGSEPIKAPYQFATQSIQLKAPANFVERSCAFWLNNTVENFTVAGQDLFQTTGIAWGVPNPKTIVYNGQTVNLLEKGCLLSALQVQEDGKNPLDYPEATHPHGVPDRNVFDLGGNNFDTVGQPPAEAVALPAYFRLCKPHQWSPNDQTPIEAAVESTASGRFSAPLDIPTLNLRTDRVDPYNRMRPEFGGPGGSDWPSTGGGCTDDPTADPMVGRVGGDARAWIWGSRFVWDAARKMALGIYSPHRFEDSGPTGATWKNQYTSMLGVYSDVDGAFRVYEAPLSKMVGGTWTSGNPVSGVVGHLFDNIDIVGRTLYKYTLSLWAPDPGYYFQPQVIGLDLDAITSDTGSVLDGAAVVSDLNRPLDEEAKDTVGAAMAYHAALDRMYVLHKSKLWYYDFVTATWSALIDLGFSVTGAYHNLGNYNPVSGWLVIGGGAGGEDVNYEWVGVDPAGNIVSLDDSPVILSVQEQPSPQTRKAAGCALPGTSKHIFFHDNGNAYTLDPTLPTGKQWENLGAYQAWAPDGSDAIAPIDWVCSIQEHGCILIGSYGGYGTNRMRIFKA